MKKRILNFSNVFNSILLLILVTLWLNAIFMHGIAGAVSWGLLKLIFAPAGVILFIICFIALMRSIIKKKNIFQKVISLILSAAIAFPIFMLLNLIPMAYPIKLENTLSKVTIYSPFHEAVIVGWGGDTIEKNAPHVIWASERWAYDLVMEPKNVGSDKLQDYGIYDEEVYSPISGTVVATYDKEDDIKPNTEDFKSMEGNYVYIKIKETQTYLLLNHLKKNSVVVKSGDCIEVGDYIGKVGNSGSTSEPHLHIHHQRQDPTKTIYPIFAEGLPLYFYDENGNSYMPVSGDIIKKAENSAIETAHTPMNKTGDIDPANEEEKNQIKVEDDSINNNDMKNEEDIGFELVKTENIGPLKLGMSEEELFSCLGEAEESTEPVMWEADGLEHETWFYEAKGIKLDLVNSDSKKIVNMITVESPCKYSTKNNIGIGSTKEEVQNAYNGMINNGDGSDDILIAGSIYGGIIFKIEGNQVISIFIGAAAE